MTKNEARKNPELAHMLLRISTFPGQDLRRCLDHEDILCRTWICVDLNDKGRRGRSMYLVQGPADKSITGNMYEQSGIGEH